MAAAITAASVTASSPTVAAASIVACHCRRGSVGVVKPDVAQLSEPAIADESAGEAAAGGEAVAVLECTFRRTDDMDPGMRACSPATPTPPQSSRVGMAVESPGAECAYPIDPRVMSGPYPGDLIQHLQVRDDWASVLAVIARRVGWQGGEATHRGPQPPLM